MRRQENALLREDLANAEKMLDAMRFKTPEASRGEHGVGQEMRADEEEQKSFDYLPEGEAETQEEPKPRPSESAETRKPRCETKGASSSESGKGTGAATKAEGRWQWQDG